MDEHWSWQLMEPVFYKCAAAEVSVSPFLTTTSV